MKQSIYTDRLMNTARYLIEKEKIPSNPQREEGTITRLKKEYNILQTKINVIAFLHK